MKGSLEGGEEELEDTQSGVAEACCEQELESLMR